MASDRNGDDKASHILHSFNTVIEHYQAEEHEALQMFRESNAAEMEKLFEKVEMLRSQRKSLEGHKQKVCTITWVHTLHRQKLMISTRRLSRYCEEGPLSRARKLSSQ